MKQKSEKIENRKKLEVGKKTKKNLETKNLKKVKT